MQTVPDQVREAMLNLSATEYSAIRDVFGTVLEKRSKHDKPDCALLNLLATRHHLLELLNEDCGIYVRELGLVDARRKCEKELLGQAVGRAREFNGAFGDFWSEIAAIRVLSDEGYHRFKPIFKEQSDKTTADYEAFRGADRAHIEVKNMRSTETILNVFDEELRRLHDSEPQGYSFNIEVRYPYDKRPTGEQERAIRAFLSNICGQKPPFERSLDLNDAVAQIKVIEGNGTVFMSRSLTLDSAESLDKEKFLAKVRDKADEALAQMRNSQCLRVLVINFDSASGSISDEFVWDAKNVISAQFNGRVEPYVLLYRYRV
jgi:hypothetical protein